ncbi:MAG: cyclomaltodextrinase N-terminal domain-containing protein [Hymenobacter sp.]
MPFAKLLLVLLLLAGNRLAATATTLVASPSNPLISRIDPTFWWVGMKNPKLQLLVHGPGLAASQVAMASYPGVTLDSFQHLESPNYLLVNLTISSTARPGRLQLEFQGSEKGHLCLRVACSHYA